MKAVVWMLAFIVLIAGVQCAHGWRDVPNIHHRVP
jgi:hypothetical protein